MKNALYVLLGVMAGFVLAGLLVFVSRAPEGEPIILQPAPTKAPIAVHVIGAVPRPGLYEFAEGSRLQDAINAAGGLLASANVDSLNLAALLEDGQQLNIPYKDGVAPTEGPAQPVLPASTEAPTTDPNVELLDINIATLEELIALPGIGPATAQKIIDYRTVNGPFSTVDDLDKVSGIGPSTLDQIRALVTVN
jgi:competence protein ComEA